MLQKRFVVLLFAAALTVLVSAPVWPAGDTTVTLELKDVDARSAIEALFKGTGRNVAIDPDVSGIQVASISFKDVAFDQALKNLVKSAGLVYRLDDGIYHISRKPQLTNTAPIATTPEVAVVDTTVAEESQIEKVPLSNTGASEILNMMNNTSNSSNQSNWGNWGNNSSFGSNFGNSFGNNSGSSFGSNNWGSNNYGNRGNYGSNYGNRGYNSYGSGNYRGW